MKERDTKPSGVDAWLIRRDGPLSGTKYRIQDAGLRVGRAPENDLVLEGEDARTVSGRHLEIRRNESEFEVIDLESTNGVLLDGEEVSSAAIASDSIIKLGPGGPEYQFLVEEAAPPSVEKTVLVTRQTSTEPDKTEETTGADSGEMDTQQEAVLNEAVAKARRMRSQEGHGHTLFIMREVLSTTVKRSTRPFKVAVLVLAVFLVGVSAYAFLMIRSLNAQKTEVDNEINRIETRLSAVQDPSEMDSLIQELDRYEQRAREIQRSLLYQIGARSEEEDFLNGEIRALMSEFGAEQYIIPPEFIQQVRRYIKRFQERDRRHIEQTLVKHRGQLEKIRTMLGEENLPPDLAYMVLIESAFDARSTSSAGAAGLWQLVPATARANGLEVSETVDERFDPDKSTRAAARYLRHLIVEFGTGSSVMLALAAYNGGPGRVKRAIRKVKDPIRQRNFWYLYRTRALPLETRGYVPKIIAAIIIGRNPVQLGFRTPSRIEA